MRQEMQKLRLEPTEVTQDETQETLTPQEDEDDESESTPRRNMDQLRTSVLREQLFSIKGISSRFKVPQKQARELLQQLERERIVKKSKNNCWFPVPAALPPLPAPRADGKTVETSQSKWCTLRC